MRTDSQCEGTDCTVPYNYLPLLFILKSPCPSLPFIPRYVRIAVALWHIAIRHSSKALQHLNYGTLARLLYVLFLLSVRFYWLSFHLRIFCDFFRENTKFGLALHEPSRLNLEPHSSCMLLRRRLWTASWCTSSLAKGNRWT